MKKDDGRGVFLLGFYFHILKVSHCGQGQDDNRVWHVPKALGNLNLPSAAAP